MKSKHLIVILCLAFAALSFYIISDAHNKTGTSIFTQPLPAFFTDSIYLDKDNSFSEAKVELGRYLFYDRRLSINKTKSCASCHDQKFAFTDGYKRSVGAFGDLHQRNASPLINIVYKKFLTAADSSLHFPEQQINNPMFHKMPVELGWQGNENEILNRVKQDILYREKFEAIFGRNDQSITIKSVQYCIASFVKSILSYTSTFDKYFYQNTGLPTASLKRGMQLFFSQRLGCASCHGGNNFDQPTVKDTSGNVEYYFNTGLYNIDNGNYPGYDQGLFELTRNSTDKGKYRVPTLRNLAFTAPYYHDGSAATLEEVVMNYENAGREITKGLFQGSGVVNPYKSKMIHGFSLTASERKDLINFLLSLSDSTILTNKNFSNPFLSDETQL